MRTINYLLVVIAMICNCMLQSLFAQGLQDKALADSLISELPKVKSDTGQVKLLVNVAKVLSSLDPAQALNYANKAMDLAKKVNWTKGVGLACMNKATIYVTTSDYVAGLENAEEAYKIFKSLKWKPGMASALVEISNSYESLGNYSKAIEHNFKALSIYEDAGMDKDVANVYVNLGNNYYWLLDYSKAIENYKKAYELHKKMNDKQGTASALDNIALVYLDQAEYQNANDYNLQAIRLFEEINDSLELAITYSIRGAIMKELKDFITALEYISKAIAINQKFDIKGNLVNNYSSMGDLYLSAAKGEALKSIPASFKISKTALIQKARFYFTEALELSKQTNKLILMMEETALLSETEALSGNYKTALAWYKESIVYKDSIFNDENKKKIAALENQRLAEVKDKEIQLLNKEKALRASEQEKKDAEAKRIKNIQYFTIAALIIVVLAVISIAFIQWQHTKQKQKANVLLQQQKEKVERTLTELKSTQAQLIHSAKMASLGELTAGIAHEIQNPLNFVNNFSEVNKELIDELQGGRSKVKSERNEELEDEILNDVKQNLEKIIHHGKRADAIVKGMLQHSRVSTGQKELADINKLTDEYLRLSYHGMRAKDKSFNATLQTDFDTSIGKINVVPQDIGRVFLNLFNNAFYSVMQKKKETSDEYGPTVFVSTKKLDGKVEIRVKDNGTGIPQKVIDKIFQPFFTTKPTGQGTGLGLSLSYDIVKAHGGEIKVETKESEGAEFIIQLPAL